MEHSCRRRGRPASKPCATLAGASGQAPASGGGGSGGEVAGVRNSFRFGGVRVYGQAFSEAEWKSALRHGLRHGRIPVLSPSPPLAGGCYGITGAAERPVIPLDPGCFVAPR